MMNIAILLLGCIVDTYLMYLFFSHYFDERRFFANSKIKYIFYIAFACTWFIANLLGDGDYNLFISAILIFGYIMTILEGKYFYKLFYYMLLFVIQFGCEFLFMLFFQPHAESYKNSLDTALQMLAIKFLTYLIIVLITQFTGKVKRKMSGKILVMYLCLPIASITVMIVNFYAGTYQRMPEKMKIPVLLGFCFLFVGNVVISYAFYLHSQNVADMLEQQVVLTKQEADLLLYNRVMQMNEAQRELAHNTKHHLLLISKYASENNVESILKMTTQLSEEMKENDKKIFTTNSVLNAILNEKYAEAAENGIKADFYVEPGVNIEQVSAIDLVSMVGNILDNAIRAANSCTEKKFIKVYVYMQEIGGFCVVKVVNGFSDKLVYENGRLKSTKKEKGIHGIGVRSVSRLAEKYGGTFVCSPKGSVFEAILLLSTM